MSSMVSSTTSMHAVILDEVEDGHDRSNYRSKARWARTSSTSSAMHDAHRAHRRTVAMHDAHRAHRRDLQHLQLPMTPMPRLQRWSR